MKFSANWFNIELGFYSIIDKKKILTAEVIVLPSLCLVAQKHDVYLIYFHDLAKTQSNKERMNNLPRNQV